MRRIVAVILVATMLAACGAAPQTSGPAASAATVTRTTLTAAIEAPVTNLTPGLDTGGSQDLEVMSNIYNLLVRFKVGTSELVPALAEKWETSADGKAMTFHLRKGVQFARGYGELTSDDVKFSFDRQVDPKFKSRYGQNWKVVSSVQAPDKYTVIVNFKTSSPGFLAAAIAYNGGYVVSKKAAEELGKDFALKPVGSGPFYVDQVGTDGVYTLLAHEQYFLGAPKLKKVVLKPIVDPIVAWNALKAGEIDITYTRSGEVYKLAQDSKELTVKTAPSQAVRSVYINTTHKPLDNRSVREAIAHAVDKNAIVKQALDNTGAVQDSVLAQGTWSHTKDVAAYPYDVAKAKQLLSQAGYPDGFPLTAIYQAAEPYPTIAAVLQQQLAKVGIKLTIVSLEKSKFTADSSAGKYDLVIQGLSRPPDPDSAFVEGWYGPSKPPGLNYSYYSGADKLIDQVRSENDPEKRRQLSVQAQQKIAEDIPAVVIYSAYYIAVMKAEVQDYTVGINAEMDLYQVWIGTK